MGFSDWLIKKIVEDCEREKTEMLEEYEWVSAVHLIKLLFDQKKINETEMKILIAGTNTNLKC